jgi:hypothetical protein
MTTRIVEADAVLKAADEWVTAQEILVDARRAGEPSEAEEEAVDIAGSRLVVAVMHWRSKRGAAG